MSGLGDGGPAGDAGSAGVPASAGVPGSGSRGVRVAVGLGSNLGDRLDYLRGGARWLAGILADLRCSRVYETRPRDVSDQPPFLNACCVGRTALEPAALLARLHEGERRAGRRREGEERYGPRVLDLDLLLYGERTVDRPGLRVPHPRLPERAFALVPLAELAGDWTHPERGVTVAEMAARVEGQGVAPLAGVALPGAEAAPGAGDDEHETEGEGEGR